MSYFVAMVLAIGLGLPIAVLSAAMAQGRAASSALEGIARQPEAAGKIQLAMIIGLAIIESLVIYVLVIVLLLLFTRLPATDAILKLIH
ncbi:MAG: ATP synthase F0 subunit C [Armatimonadota bacterium]|nr:ATP synthase F0 subunit C [Armatimonadota bacterium]